MDSLRDSYPDHFVRVGGPISEVTLDSVQPPGGCPRSIAWRERRAAAWSNQSIEPYEDTIVELFPHSVEFVSTKLHNPLK